MKRRKSGLLDATRQIALRAGKAKAAGTAELSLECVRDRLAILNLLGAYAHFANMAAFEDWCSLFAKDATFAISAPGAPGKPLPIADIFIGEKYDFDARLKILQNPGSDERKWYQLLNPYIIRQTANEADLTVDLVNTRVLPEGPAPRIQNCGKYMGTLRKQDGNWLIHRWSVDTCRIPEPFSKISATWWTDMDALGSGRTHEGAPFS